jgi:hypothetical protein
MVDELISRETIENVRERVSSSCPDAAQAGELTYKIAFLVVGYVSLPRKEEPAKQSHRRLKKMSRSLGAFQEELGGLDPEIRSSLNRELGTNKSQAEAWGQLKKNAKALARSISEFEDGLSGRKRSNTDAKRLFQDAAKIWHRAAGKWPSTTLNYVGSRQEPKSPLYCVIRELAKHGAMTLTPKERNELLYALTANCFVESVRAAKSNRE